MLVCHCKRVNDRKIRRAVRDGAVTVHAIARHCEAGAGCGGCHGAIEDIIGQECASSQGEILSLADYAPAL